MIAVNKKTALKMFWDAGYDTEAKLLAAAKLLEGAKQPTAGYYLADDVAALIAKVA